MNAFYLCTFMRKDKKVKNYNHYHFVSKIKNKFIHVVRVVHVYVTNAHMIRVRNYNYLILKQWSKHVNDFIELFFFICGIKYNKIIVAIYVYERAIASAYIDTRMFFHRNMFWALSKWTLICRVNWLIGARGCSAIESITIKSFYAKICKISNGKLFFFNKKHNQMIIKQKKMCI